jgi:ABC-2 type transport system permease protein
VAIYTVALGFSLSHLVVLSWLGNPDPGLMASTYLGYWLMGAALIAVAMVGSLLTDNLTVAFILGAALTAIPVFLHHAEVLVGGGLRRLLVRLSIFQPFSELASGVVTPAALVYFLALAAVMLTVNVALLGRRHWPTGRDRAWPRGHLLLRTSALLVSFASLTLLAAHARMRLDLTAEKLHSLAPETLALVRSLSPERPVFITAYLSPEVPDAYLETRANLLAILGELSAVSDGRVETRIVEAEKYSAEAREARDLHDIRPVAVPAAEQSRGAPREILLGLVFSCGAEEMIIPFFDRGLPVEYELVRSIRTVANARRLKVGFLETGVDVFGGFDFERRHQAPEWSIVAELGKQYEVVAVPPAADYPDDLDVLVAPLPTTLTRKDLARLTEAARAGRPLLVLLDPLPAFDLDLAPSHPPGGPLGPPSARRPSTNAGPLLEALGLRWPKERIVWSKDNPHPELRRLPPEVVFVTAGPQDTPAFNPDEPVSAGLQEVVLIYPGVLEPAEGADLDFAPLLSVGARTGTLPFSRLVVSSFFGVSLASGLRHDPDDKPRVLAARVRGRSAGGVNAIVIADCDLMGEQFFEIRKRGVERLRFDNVAFLLNAVDHLAGDDAMIALRRRRPRHRRLEALEVRTRQFEERRLLETREAESFAQAQLDDAQKRMDRAVEALRRRADVDEQTREIMLQNLSEVENRRLTVARTRIEDERGRRIEASRADMETAVRAIQSTIKLAAVVLPPIPAFVLFLVVSARRLRRERLGIRAERLVRHNG